jgi:hypothetical protein
MARQNRYATLRVSRVVVMPLAEPIMERGVFGVSKVGVRGKDRAASADLKLIP